jgi:phage terminase Nu1 subunit (DNA packaging protein)
MNAGAVDSAALLCALRRLPLWSGSKRIRVVAKKATAKPKRPAKLDPEDWLNGEDTEAESPAPADDSEDEDTARGTAGMLVNKSRLGLIFGLSQSAIDKMLANGAPFISKGSRKIGWRFNTAAFYAWLRQETINSIVPEDPNKLSFDEAKAKKTQAEYERIEMGNRLKRRELVTIDEVVSVMREESSLIRSHLMAIPGRVAIPAAAESDPGIVEALMTDEINVALQNIAADNPEAWTDGNDGTADSAE